MSLVDGWFPWLVGLVAVGLAALVIVLRRSRFDWRAVVIVVSAAALATIVVVRLAHSTGGLIADPTDEYPQYINVIAFGALVLVGVAVVGWPGAKHRARVALLAAPVLMAMFAADQLAIRYGYPPDLRTLLGMEVAGAHRYHPGELGTSPTTVVTTQPGTGAAPPGKQTTSTVGAAAAPTTVARPRSAQPLEQTFHPTQQPSEGKLLSGVPIPGTISGFNARTAYVWLPPAFFATPRPALPVMIWLAGVPGQPKNYPAGLDAHTVFAAFAGAHHGLAPIMVFADSNGGMTDDRGCTDSAQGNVETYLSKDVPNFAAATFGSETGPAALGIGGFSDGGTCALMIGLRHPDVFGPIVSFSADQSPTYNGRQGYIDRFLGGDATAYTAHSPIDLLANHAPRPATTIYLAAGDQEPKKQAQTIAMANAARVNGLPLTLVTKPGKHNFDFWRQCLADSAEWVARSLGVI